MSDYDTLSAEDLLAAEWGTRVADSQGDIWKKQGGRDSWKMAGTTGLRTTSERLADLWGPLVLVPDEGVTGK